MKDKYENYGDINPLVYGGQWIKQTGESEYDIITLQIDEDNGNYYLGGCLLDITDTWINKKSVEDNMDTIKDNKLYALNVVGYYGVENCGGSIETLKTQEEVIERLNDMGITELGELE
jgi:hypothetical protein